MRLFLTRIGGENCIVNGDIMQRDIRGKNGLTHAISLPKAGFHHFSAEDCGRSDMVKNILARYEQ